MKPAPTLNEAQVHKWAAVAFGQAWKAWALSPHRKLTAEYMFGPLIVWATKPGEGGSVGTSGPVVFPLEVRAAEVNMAPHFLAFVRAAQGKVRHSVRWKTGRKVRRLRVLEALRRVRYAAHLLKRRAEGRRGFTACMAPKTAKARREARREWKAERLEDRLRQIAPAWADEDNPNGWDDRRLTYLSSVCRAVKSRGPLRTSIAVHLGIHVDHWADALAFAVATGDRGAIGELLSLLTVWRVPLDGLLAALRRAAFRAHLARRVKPVSRRTRAPRPLYARPRPPTAPLAPPVA